MGTGSIPKGAADFSHVAQGRQKKGRRRENQNSPAPKASRLLHCCFPHLLLLRGAARGEAEQQETLSQL